MQYYKDYRVVVTITEKLIRPFTKVQVSFYLQIVVVFYVAIVLLLIGTNLRAGGGGRGARFKKHVVEFTEVHSYIIYNCIYIYIYI